MEGRAIQRSVRQSPRKMRLVMDLIRGKNVNEAYAILQFNKKLAAKQIAKTLKSAVANAEQHAQNASEDFDVDQLIVVDAQVDMGPPLNPQSRSPSRPPPGIASIRRSTRLSRTRRPRSVRSSGPSVRLSTWQAPGVGGICATCAFDVRRVAGRRTVRTRRRPATRPP